MGEPTSDRARGFLPQDFGIGRLFYHIRDAVVVADAASEQIVLWNEAAETLFGYSEYEAMRLPLHALVSDDMRDRHRAGLARYQETGEGELIDGGHPVELVGVHKDGYEIPIELTLTRVPQRTSDGHRFALAIVRDVSERKEAEKANRRLHEAESDRRRALELNDTIVQGLAVAKMALENDDHELGLQTVTETLKRAQAIVARLLAEIEVSEGGIEPGSFVRREPADEES